MPTACLHAFRASFFVAAFARSERIVCVAEAVRTRANGISSHNPVPPRVAERAQRTVASER
jgi:hypothetical protein